MTPKKKPTIKQKVKAGVTKIDSLQTREQQEQAISIVRAEEGDKIADKIAGSVKLKESMPTPGPTPPAPENLSPADRTRQALQRSKGGVDYSPGGMLKGIGNKLTEIDERRLAGQGN